MMRAFWPPARPCERHACARCRERNWSAAEDRPRPEKKEGGSTRSCWGGGEGGADGPPAVAPKYGPCAICCEISWPGCFSACVRYTLTFVGIEMG